MIDRKGLVGLVALVAMVTVWVGVRLGVDYERDQWREAECARGNAVVMDTLCVRPDSSWRVSR